MAKYYVAAGLSSRDQHRVGRNELLNTSFLLSMSSLDSRFALYSIRDDSICCKFDVLFVKSISK